MRRIRSITFARAGELVSRPGLPRPASGEGKLELTKAPRSCDRGRGNSRRVPLRTAVVGVPREARKREAACVLAPFQSSKASAPIGLLGPELCFDDVWFRALYKCDDLMAFSLRDLKRVQSGIDMTQKRRPIGLADFHPFVRGLHIPSGVVHGPACTRTQKINQELLFPLYPVLSSMLPEASQSRIRL